MRSILTHTFTYTSNYKLCISMEKLQPLNTHTQTSGRGRGLSREKTKYSYKCTPGLSIENSLHLKIYTDNQQKRKKHEMGECHTLKYL